MCASETGNGSVYLCIFQMIMKNIVYSTDGENFCPDCGKKIAICICCDKTENDKYLGPILIERQTSGRRGKPVSVIKNIPLQKTDLKRLAKELKKHLGVGGSCSDGNIIIQGSHKERLIDLLGKKGFVAK